MFEEDPFDGIDISDEAKAKLEKKLIELNIRMNGRLTNANRREFILFSLAMKDGVPEFLRKLYEIERQFVILHTTRRQSFLNLNADTLNNKNDSNEITVDHYKIVYDKPPPVLRSILKKPATSRKKFSRRRKHKKLKKVRFNLPDENNDNDTNYNQNDINREQMNTNENTETIRSESVNEDSSNMNRTNKISISTKFKLKKKNNE